MLMQVRLIKLSDERHALEVVRADGSQERVEHETRSYLLHDLLHFAVESIARIEDGFWGQLARGTTLAQLNDRSGEAAPMRPEMMLVEQVVGALHTAVKGHDAAHVHARLHSYADSIGLALPPWLTVRFIRDVQARMRALRGHWSATPYRGAMQLEWVG